MARAAQVARNHEDEPYVPRIREHLENARLKAARELLAEALSAGSREPGLDWLSKLLAPPRQTVSPVKDVDRSAEFRWLAKHGEEYKGQWVAMLGEGLLAHAPTLDELIARLKTVPHKGHALLHHVG
jgi:Family of unknown function (DUF5678)